MVIDGNDQPRSLAGKTTIWADGDDFRAIRATLTGQKGFTGKQYERTVAMVDISDKDFYLLDVFRVVGGKDHAKFMHSHSGTIRTAGLALDPAPDYGHGTQMRNFRSDPRPRPGWSVDWKADDLHNLLPPGSEVHLRYTDLTSAAQASICEAWVVKGGYSSSGEMWIPRVMVRRQAEAAPLQSTFVSVIEPYEKKSNIQSIRRLPLEDPEGNAYPDACAAVEVRLRDGRRDLFISADAENPLGLKPNLRLGKALVQKDWGARVEGEMAWIRMSENGAVERAVLCRCTGLKVGDLEITLKHPVEHVELRFEDGRPIIVAGGDGIVFTKTNVPTR